MITFEGKCGESKVERTFDPPADLTVKILNLGKCSLEVAFLDASGTAIPVSGKQKTKVETKKTTDKADEIKGTKVSKLVITCSKETAKEGDEHTTADAKDCTFRYETVYDDCTCPTTIEFKDQGSTWNKSAYTDFSSNASGAFKPAEFKDVPGDPNNINVDDTSSLSKPTDLGYVEGTFPNDDVGYYKKTEVDIRTEAPCKIVEVARSTKKLSGYDVPGTTTKEGPDPIDARRSLTKESDQHWIVTDAPGPTLNGPGQIVFFKEYTITVTFQCSTTKKFKESLTYEVLIRTNKKGQLELKPNKP